MSYDTNTAEVLSVARNRQRAKHSQGTTCWGPVSPMLDEAQRENQPFVALDAETALLVTEAGQRLRILPRHCPHRQADLTAVGELSVDERIIRCRHRHYLWSAEDGRIISVGASGSSADIRLKAAVLGADGMVRQTGIEGYPGEQDA